MFKHLIFIGLALICFFIAFLGALLPIIPGFVFFFLGIIILSWSIPFVQRWLHKLLHKFPKLEKHVLKAENRLKKWLKVDK
ncbi:hypothetical protein [Facilibium subflavum]|uniref:hypothetical protein n=1 Tax=Facilibium subflavum TaxID=2219058 RepID=UPI000E652AA6|nr:hypothetical protein [Facilibium subflavum]